MDVPLLRPDQVDRVVIRLEGEGPHAVPHSRHRVLEVLQLLGEVDHEEVGEPERGLDDGPVGHPPVPGAAVEVHVAVQVVFGPVNLHRGATIF